MNSILLKQSKRNNLPLRNILTVFQYISFGTLKWSVSAWQNGPFRSLKQPVSQREKGRIANTLNVNKLQRQCLSKIEMNYFY